MDCQRTLKVEPLSEGEAWNLFVEKLGHGVGLFPETKQIVAESIVKECAGLPLGIVTMAGSMKGVEPEYRWRDALQRLRISEVGPRDVKTKVLRVLEVSYDQLNDLELRKCFLHVTLFPKGKIILREDLIEHLIDEGIIVEMGWRRSQFDRVIRHDLRNYKLNLGESSFFHHLIRLKVLDLSDTDIEKLPDSICHLTKLTVLLLGWCAKLSYVPSLAKLTALKKLDLSYTLKNEANLVEVHEVLRLQRLETLECNFRDLENFEFSTAQDPSSGFEGFGMKKLPSLNNIYSGRLECNSLEEITVNDCPWLTTIPLTIPHTLKKIQVDPESLRNSIEWAIISEEPVSNPQEDALHS
uniref:Disease resistance R13L4/SHOC-2-like LRR domain-containing protein n=1 Tax=Salix viminalis TaxID=40686 RepID=A0A6N2MIX2_SALVM